MLNFISGAALGLSVGMAAGYLVRPWTDRPAITLAPGDLVLTAWGQAHGWTVTRQQPSRPGAPPR